MEMGTTPLGDGWGWMGQLKMGMNSMWTDGDFCPRVAVYTEGKKFHSPCTC